MDSLGRQTRSSAYRARLNMQILRGYQERAVNRVRLFWANGVRRVLLVSPTGSGKTRMGEELILPFGRALWLAHRTELIKDASERLAKSLGALDVGCIAPGFQPSPHARVQVATVQSALARGARPHAELVVLDEGHHFAADDWGKLVSAYPEAKFLILTATPERQDGRGLDGIADAMVVAAEYSELLAEGHLCRARVFRPDMILGNALALDPVEAWKKYSEGSPGFAFFASVDAAYEHEHRMNAEGIRAAVVEQGTPKADRTGHIEALRHGDLDVICNVYTMTEGVDIPRARVCMLAARLKHCGGYLQRVGRVLRPHESKPNAIVIDLVGATHLHGLPTENRVYSLTGEPIKRKEITPLKGCDFCGAQIPSASQECPECGFKFTVNGRARTSQKIFSLELLEVIEGLHTASDVKRKAYAELRATQRENGYDLAWIQGHYKRTFVEGCFITDATPTEKRAELGKLKALAASKGFKSNFARVRFQQLFGHWPSD